MVNDKVENLYIFSRENLRELIKVESWFLKISLILKFNSDSNNALLYMDRGQPNTSSVPGFCVTFIFST